MKKKNKEIQSSDSLIQENFFQQQLGHLQDKDIAIKEVRRMLEYIGGMPSDTSFIFDVVDNSLCITYNGLKKE